MAGALIVKFWFPDSNATLWAMGFFMALMALNLLSVRAFAEAEYWFASIKVTVVLVFLVIGVALILGLLGGEAVGLKHWTLADPVSHARRPSRWAHGHPDGLPGGGLFIPGHRGRGPCGG